MARPLRPDYTDTYHHVVIRGVNGLPIFDVRKKRNQFLDYLREEREDHDLRVYAFGFLSNHWHVFVRRVEQSLSKFFQNVKSRYTRWYNQKYHREGTLYGSRFYSALVDSESYFQRVWLYVQRQGVAAGLYNRSEEDPGSTAGLYAGVHDEYDWIDWEEALETLDVPTNTLRLDVRQFADKDADEDLPIRRERDQNFVADDAFIEKYMQIRRSEVREKDRHESPVSWETLYAIVRRHFGLKSPEIRKPTKKQPVNRYRAGLAYAARKYGHKSCAEVADELNVTDSTVSRMVEKVQNKFDDLRSRWDRWMQKNEKSGV